MNERSANEPLMRLEELELRLDQREELLLEWRSPQSGVASYNSHGVVDFKFKEIKRNIFLGREVIEHRAFSDSGAAGDRLGRCGIEALLLEQGERRVHDPFADRLAVLVAAAFSCGPAHGPGSSCGRSHPQYPRGDADWRASFICEYTHV